METKINNVWGNFWRKYNIEYKFSNDEKEIIRKTKYKFKMYSMNFSIEKFEYIYTDLFEENYDLSILIPKIFTNKDLSVKNNLLKFLERKNILKYINNYNFTNNVLNTKKRNIIIHKQYVELLTLLIKNGYELFYESELIKFCVDNNDYKFLLFLIEKGLDLKININNPLINYMRHRNEFIKIIINSDVNIEDIEPHILYKNDKLLEYESQILILDKFPKLANKSLKEVIKVRKYNKLSNPDKHTPKIISDYYKYDVDFYSDIDTYIKYFGLGYLKFIQKNYNEFNIEGSNLLNTYLSARLRLTYWDALIGFEKIDTDVIKFLLNNGALKNVDRIELFDNEVKEVILTY